MNSKAGITFLFFIFFWICLFPAGWSQTSLLNNNPPSVKWERIRSEHTDIIYPKPAARDAQRLAQTMDALYEPVSYSLGARPHRISIILQNQNAISNGFVTLSPRRSEFYYMPPQRHTFLGTNDWLELLAVHEFRHVVQFEKGKRGLIDLAHTAFGQNVRAFLGNIAVPLWFWEGDAVALETVMTPSGRGRQPEFDMLFRANLLERGGFNYHKQYLRSFKHAVPNHYVTGYLLSTYLRRQYDFNPWDQVTARAFKWPIIPFTFSLAMRKETGMGLEKTYQASLLEQEYLYRDQIDKTQLTVFEDIHNPKRRSTYTDYEFPLVLGNGLKVALKSGLSDIQQWVTWNDKGKERVLHVPGLFNNTGYASAGKHKFAWLEFEVDPRWRMKTYSVVKIFDTRSNQMKVLQRKSKHISAAISPDDHYIALLNADEQGDFNLELWDLTVGLPVKKWPKSRQYISHITWADDGQHIVFVRHQRGEKSIHQLQVWTGEETELLPPGEENVALPQKRGNHLWYQSPDDGIDNIYVLDLENNRHYQVVSSKYAAFHPAFSTQGNSIIYADFTKDGFSIVGTSIEKDKWVAKEKIPDRRLNYFQPLEAQEPDWNIRDLEVDTLKQLSSQAYKPLLKGFSIYEWGVISNAPDNQLRIGVRGQNMLSTINATAGVGVRSDELLPFPFLNVSFQGLYPIFNASATYGQRQLSLDGDTLRWEEGNYSLQALVPLNLTNSKYFRSLSFAASTSVVQVLNSPFGEGSSPRLLNGWFGQNTYQIRGSRLLKTAPRDLTSRWGQSFGLIYAHTPLGAGVNNQVIAGEGRLYFPGPFRHHHLILRGGYVQRQASNFNLGNQIALARGYFFYGANQMAVSSIDYLFPLWYPDIHLGPFINFQRLRVQLFHDYGRDFLPNGSVFNQQSLGADIYIDFNVMRYLPLLNAGIRVGYFPATGTPFFNFLLGGIGI